MPKRLSRRATLLLVVLGFGLPFAAQALHAARPSAEPHATQPTIASLGADAPSADTADPDIRLAAAGTVPALREPRVRRARRTKPKRPRVTSATPTAEPPAVAPTPTATATPTPVPRFSPAPTPQPRPAPKPQPKPVATPTPASGEFDTSGEP